MLDPLLFATEVHAHVVVPEGAESISGDLRAGARPAAVHDDVAALVRDHLVCQIPDPVRGDVDCTWQVGIGEVPGTERLDQHQLIAPLEGFLELRHRDRVGAGTAIAFHNPHVGAFPCHDADNPAPASSCGDASTVGPVQIDILGPLRVRAGDVEVHIRRGIPRLILTALALRVGDVVTTATLADVVWGDHQPRNPANALQVQVSYLRRALLAGGEEGQAIVTAGSGYRLVVSSEDVDARRFETIIRRVLSPAEASPDGGDLGRLDEALALWRGEPLQDLADAAFAEGDRSRLEELRWEAVEARYDLLLAMGRHREVIGELSQLTAEEPLRERFHEQKMLALYRSDRQSDALRAYDQARTVLVEELGLDPGKGLNQLQARILASDPTLDVVSAELATDAPVATGVGVANRSVAVLVPAAPPPIPLTPTVGREVEIARLHALSQRNRLVTLTGPAGAGKTRLAVELGLLEQEACRVVYVDFGPVPAAELVAATVAGRLGLSVLPDDDVVQQIADRLADQPTLLVLDTCEHVLEAAAAIASRTVHRSETSRVLATSQRPLGITGEIAWPVPPLALAPPDATEADTVRDFPAILLFEQRAVAVNPEFSIHDGNAADVAAICLSLDGLPLAIELAAAQAVALSPASIRSRLEDRFAVLVGGSSDVVHRQQTLRAALDWSYALLDTDQRRLLGRLSVCPGSFDLDAATSLAPPDVEDPVSVLASLVRHSVVMRDGEERFRLLDSVRAYAAEKLDDLSAASRAHAEHFLAFAETAFPHLRSADQLEWLARVRQDIPQLRAAWRWASSVDDEDIMARLVVALAWFWTLEGMLDEAMHIYDRVLDLSTPPPGTRARLLASFALLVASLGDLRGARKAAQEALDRLVDVDDPGALGDALNALAVAQWALGEYTAAADTHERAFEAYRSVGDLWGVGVAVTLRARTAVDAGEPDVQSLAADAVTAARVCGDRHIVALALDQLGRVALAAGDTTSATEHAQESLSLNESVGYVEGTVASLHLLGSVYLASGQPERARQAHQRQLAMAATIGHAAAMCEAVDDLARVAARQGHLADAAVWWTTVDRERERRSLPRRLPDETEIRRHRSSLGVQDTDDPAPFEDLVTALKS